MLLAVIAALAAAGFFAAGSALQHRAAESAPRASKVAMLSTLVRRPGWLVGAAFSAAAFSLHATALRLGDLSLVQPVIVSGIVFAVVIRAAIDRRWPSRGEVGWAGLTWAGLALFIAVLRSGPPQEADGVRAIGLVVVGVLVAGALVVAERRSEHPRNRGLMLGTAAGILFGLVAGLLKLSTDKVGDPLPQLVLQWPPWVLLAVGAWAVVMNQRAYQATRLSVTTPVLNIVQLLVAMGFGVVVFDEQVFSSPTALAAELVGLLAMGVGVGRLAGRAGQSESEQPESTVETADPRG